MPLGDLFVQACNMNNLDFIEEEKSIFALPPGNMIDGDGTRFYSINHKYWFKNSLRSLNRRLSSLIILEQPICSAMKTLPFQKTF